MNVKKIKVSGKVSGKVHIGFNPPIGVKNEPIRCCIGVNYLTVNFGVTGSATLAPNIDPALLQQPYIFTPDDKDISPIAVSKDELYFG